MRTLTIKDERSEKTNREEPRAGDFILKGEKTLFRIVPTPGTGPYYVAVNMGSDTFLWDETDVVEDYSTRKELIEDLSERWSGGGYKFEYIEKEDIDLQATIK